MKSAALIFGLIAGLLGGAVLVLGNIDAGLASAALLGPDHTAIARGIVYLVPAIGWLGAGLALAYPRLGGIVLLLSAAAWAAIAFIAGHGAILFAAAPFIFAAAGGLVALFERRPVKPVPTAAAMPVPAADVDNVIAEAVAASAAPLRRRAETSPPRALPPLPASPPPVKANTEPGLPAPMIPPPFRDIAADEEPAQPLPPLAAAPLPAETAAPMAPLESSASATDLDEPPADSTPPASDEGIVVPGPRPRRPGDWTLPTPVTAVPAPRYAADRQAAAPIRIEPMAPTALPAPGQRPRGVSTLDFSPAGDFSARRNDPTEFADAPPEAPPFGRRPAEDDTPAFLPDEPADAPRRRGGLRTLLRLLIAALFIIVLLGLAAAVYLDYRRGPQSVLFGHHPHLAATAPRPASAPAALSSETPASRPAATAPAAAPPKAASTPASPKTATTPPATTPSPSPQARPQPAAVHPPIAPMIPAMPASASPAPTKAETTGPATPPVAATPAPSPAASAVATTSPAAAPAIAAADAALPASFSDPVRYCAAVGSIDAPDARYTGPTVPPAVAAALLVPQSTPADQVRWRCASGITFACNAHHGSACMPTPTVEGMLKYCALHPGATNLPAPNGTWSCQGTRPQIPEDQSWPVDPRGFFPGAWVRVSPIG